MIATCKYLSRIFFVGAASCVWRFLYGSLPLRLLLLRQRQLHLNMCARLLLHSGQPILVVVSDTGCFGKVHPICTRRADKELLRVFVVLSCLDIFCILLRFAEHSCTTPAVSRTPRANKQTTQRLKMTCHTVTSTPGPGELL